jgi:FtsZ-interacting cell division protein ZipA
MSQLRWALIGLGVVFLVALALWEWRRSRRMPPRAAHSEPHAPDITLITERPRRREPQLGEVPGVHAADDAQRLEVPTILPVDSLPLAVETAVDVPAAARTADGGQALRTPAPANPPPPARPTQPAHASEAAPEPRHQAEPEPEPDPAPAPAPVAAPAAAAAAQPSIQWPPPRSERVLTLRIMRRDGTLLPGRGLRIALEAAGLASGPQQIFHRADPHGAVIVSAANMMQPGVLDPLHMDATEYRGLSLFSVLPGPLPPVRMLEELVATARSVAHRLGAIVQDEQGGDLDGMRLIELRRSLPDGGGAAP